MWHAVRWPVNGGLPRFEELTWCILFLLAIGLVSVAMVDELDELNGFTLDNLAFEIRGGQVCGVSLCDFRNA